MLFGPTKYMQCPCCGAKKAIKSVLSGNTFESTLWSDGRSIAPMLPRVSPIQKCQHCNQYSFLHEWKELDDTCGEAGTFGDLTYAETKEAYTQLSNSKLSGEDTLTISLEFVHKFNDYFYRSDEYHRFSDDEDSLYKNALYDAISYLGYGDDEQVLKCEFFREAGDFRVAEEQLLFVKNEANSWIVEPMLYYCKLSIRKPYVLVSDGNKINSSTGSNFKTIINSNTDENNERINSVKAFIANITSINEKQTKYFESDILGGVYDSDGTIFFHLSDLCPEKYELNYTVHYIADYAVIGNSSIKAIRLPFGLRRIGVKSFWGCKNLQSINLERALSLEAIDDEAFMNCKSLESVSLPYTLKIIGRNAFAGMDKLSSVTLPEGIEYIPELCFSCCCSLHHIELPIKIREIKDDAFFDSGLKEISIPETVRNIRMGAFCHCVNLRKIDLPANITGIHDRTFMDCESLEQIVIPEHVEQITENAFSNTKSLKTIQFKGKVEFIDETAFSGSGIETIIVPAKYSSYYKELFPTVKVETALE